MHSEKQRIRVYAVTQPAMAAVEHEHVVTSFCRSSGSALSVCLYFSFVRVSASTEVLDYSGLSLLVCCRCELFS